MITLKSVCKSYTEKDKIKTILNDINLELCEKGLVVLKGKSGSGKTTLINLISGIDTCSSGTITYSDDSNFKSSLGYVFQDANLFDNLTVLENIDIYKDIDNDKLELLMKKLGIYEIKDKKAKLLSGGEKRRVALARALIKEPKVLLCDEPTASLDKENAKMVYNILREYSKDNLVIVSNHNEDLFADYDMLINLEGGNITAIKGKTFTKKEINKTNIREVNDKFIKKMPRYMLFDNKLSLVLNLTLLVICITIISLFINVVNMDYAKIQSTIMRHENDAVLKFKNDDNFSENIIKGNIFMKDGTPLNMNLNISNIDYVYYGGTTFLTFYKYNEELIGNNYIGNIPTSDNEIMIYQILAENIIYYGIIENDGTIFKPNKIDELIGKDINIGNESYIISGIIKQDVEIFQNLKKVSIQSSYDNQKDMILRLYFFDKILSFVGNIIMSDNGYNKMLSSYEVYKNFSPDCYVIEDDSKEINNLLANSYNKPNLFVALNHKNEFYINGTFYSGVLTEILYKPYCFSLIIKYTIPIFIIITTILIFIYFYNIFIKNKNKLSLLISLGFSNRNINKTILYSLFTYLSIAVILGVVISFMIFLSINTYLNSISPFYLQPFTYDVVSLILIIIFVFIVSFISYLLLLRSIKKMKISQNIRNN